MTLATAFALSAVLVCTAISQAADSEQRPFRIVYRGAITLPHAVLDSRGNEVEITGLSGITWLGHDRYAAIMDNSDKLILFSLKLDRDGTPEEASDTEVVTLAEQHDYEDVAACPEPLQQRIAALRMKQGFPDPGRCVFVCEEDTPAIRAVSLTDGSLLGVIPIPEAFSRLARQRGLESLDIDADGHHLWTANEEALSADGSPPAADRGTVVRLAKIAIPDPEQKGADEPIQLAYAVDPPHPFVRMFAGNALSGVTAITGLGNGRLLVLERAGCPGLPPFENRIYLVDTRNATDVSVVDRDLASHTETHARKVLLWKDQLGCNIEGLCMGPKLRRNTYALIAVADNGAIGTPNQLIGFALETADNGMQVPMIVGGAAIAAVVLGFVMYRLAR